MRLHAALVREQGITFGVVVVKPHVIRNRIEAERAKCSFQGLFPGVPIVLMAQDSCGTPTYFGRQDIARFLSGKPVDAIPWREYEWNLGGQG